jgi:hypothetical protein
LVRDAVELAHGDLEVAQGLRFAVVIAVLAQDRQAALVAVDRILAPAVAQLHPGQAGQRPGLTVAVTDLAHARQGAFVAADRVSQTAGPGMDAAQVRHRLGCDVSVHELEHRALPRRGPRRRAANGRCVRSP